MAWSIGVDRLGNYIVDTISQQTLAISQKVAEYKHIVELGSSQGLSLTQKTISLWCTTVLRPNGDLTNVGFTTTGSTYWDEVNAGCGDITDTRYNADTVGSGNAYIWYDLDNPPSNFQDASSCTINIRCKRSVDSGDYKSFAGVQLFESDGSTAITSSGIPNLSTTAATQSATLTINDGKTTKAVWDGARLKISLDAGTNGTVYLYEIDVIVKYVPAVGIADCNVYVGTQSITTQSMQTAWYGASVTIGDVLHMNTSVTTPQVHSDWILTVGAQAINLAQQNPIIRIAVILNSQLLNTVLQSPILHLDGRRVVDIQTITQVQETANPSIGLEITTTAFNLGLSVKETTLVLQTISIIAADGTGDYLTIQDWYDGRNVTTGYHTAYIKPNGTSGYAGATFDEPAFTQDESHCFELRGHPESKFHGIYNDNSPNYPIVGALIFTDQKYFQVGEIVINVSGSGSKTGLNITGQNILIENCGIDVAGTSTGADITVTGIQCNSAANDTTVATVRGCIIRSITATNSSGTQGSLACGIAGGGEHTGTVLNVYNCLVNTVSCTVGSGYANSIGINGAISSNNIKTLRIYNTFILNPTAASSKIKIGAGYLSSGQWTSATAPTYDCGYNATDDTSLEQGATGNQTSVTLSDEITSTTLASFNVHLKSTSTKLNRKGLNISTKPIAPTRDIDGAPWA